jgi:hypothetical protein
MEKVGWWRTFLDSLATTGGHIIVLLYLIALGAGLAIEGELHGWMGIAKIGEGMITFGLGALTMMYRPSGTNLEQVTRAGQPYQAPQQVAVVPVKVDTQEQPDKENT